MGPRFLLSLCVLIAVLALVTAAEARRERRQFAYAIQASVWDSASHYPGQRRGGYGINAYGEHENHSGDNQKYAEDHGRLSHAGGFGRGGYGRHGGYGGYALYADSGVYGVYSGYGGVGGYGIKIDEEHENHSGGNQKYAEDHRRHSLNGGYGRGSPYYG